MKTLLRNIVVLVCFVTCFSLGRAQGSFELGLRLEKEVYLEGEPINVKIVLLTKTWIEVKDR